jgi:putative endonuclease
MDGMEAGEMTEKRLFEKRAPRDGRLPTGREQLRPRASRMPSGRRTAKQLAGAAAENIAADFLRAKGLEILERNYRRRLGELDIVARDGDVLVIAEVRTRASDRYGGAAASVDARKQQRIIRATCLLLQRRKDLARLRVRFDVIVVSNIASETSAVEWIQHAFLT